MGPGEPFRRRWVRAMQLHIPTLALVAVFVTVILGALLLLAWRRDQSTDALGWWGVGYLIGGGSFALLVGARRDPDVLSIEIANALLLLGYSFLLAGTRAFGGRETPVDGVSGRAADLAHRHAGAGDRERHQPARRHRLEPAMRPRGADGLRALARARRAAAVALAGDHPARRPMCHADRTHDHRDVTPIMSHTDFFRSPVFALMAFGTVLYTITFAFVLLSMTKERTEMQHKIARWWTRSPGLPTAAPSCSTRRRRSRARVAQRAARGAARRPRPFQEDQRRVRPRDRRPGADDLRARRWTAASARMTWRAASAARSSRSCCPDATRPPRSRSPSASAWPSRRQRVEMDGHAVGATVSIGVAASRIGGHDSTGCSAAPTARSTGPRKRAQSRRGVRGGARRARARR